ncbi:hypothetical protein [Pseudoclavibacter sp. CFCC 13611]|uniref:hypothetical protein n=1 Tax=Pseudoclavibacter sp. CFCC 13611 TaxID=2615178 RepID=UPI00130140B6|nr:hypothetical protein [Pseudoclavibacter sp. CFCC 13611]KAB1662825.1 hypothetical protein F8O08_09680 [Pseudoclavibacter sp. CFCC 13611]
MSDVEDDLRVVLRNQKRIESKIDAIGRDLQFLVCTAKLDPEKVAHYYDDPEEGLGEKVQDWWGPGEDPKPGQVRGYA